MKDQIKELLKKGKTGDALEKLTLWVEEIDSEQYNRSIILLNEYKRLKDDYSLGLKKDKYEENRIVSSILLILDDIELVVPNQEREEVLLSKNRKTKNPLVILGLIVMIALTSMFLLILGLNKFMFEPVIQTNQSEPNYTYMSIVGDYSLTTFGVITLFFGIVLTFLISILTRAYKVISLLVSCTLLIILYLFPENYNLTNEVVKEINEKEPNNAIYGIDFFENDSNTVQIYHNIGINKDSLPNKVSIDDLFKKVQLYKDTSLILEQNLNEKYTIGRLDTAILNSNNNIGIKNFRIKFKSVNPTILAKIIENRLLILRIYAVIILLIISIPIINSTINDYKEINSS